MIIVFYSMIIVFLFDNRGLNGYLIVNGYYTGSKRQSKWNA